MRKTTLTAILALLFTILILAVVTFGILAIRYAQGTAEEGDYLLMLMCLLASIAIVLCINILK